MWLCWLSGETQSNWSSSPKQTKKKKKFRKANLNSQKLRSTQLREHVDWGSFISNYAFQTMIERFVSNDSRKVSPKVCDTDVKAKFPLEITRSLGGASPQLAVLISILDFTTIRSHNTSILHATVIPLGRLDIPPNVNSLFFSNEEARRADVKNIFFTRHPWDSQNNCNGRQVAQSRSQTGFMP